MNTEKTEADKSNPLFYAEKQGSRLRIVFRMSNREQKKLLNKYLNRDDTPMCRDYRIPGRCAFVVQFEDIVFIYKTDLALMVYTRNEEVIFSERKYFENAKTCTFCFQVNEDQ